MRLKNFILLFSFILAAITLGYAAIPPYTPLTGKGDPILGEAISNSQRSNNKYKIVGFIPYWNLNKVSDNSLAKVSDLIYFALELDSFGNLKTKENPGWAGIKKFQKDPRFSKVPTTISFQMLDDEEIASLLNSPTNRQNAITTILNITATYRSHGINLDLEPTGQISQKTRDNFTLFVEELSLGISKHHLANTPISIDIYPTLVGKQRIWDLPRLAPYIGYAVIMGYDYHYRGSTTAGPVSPLRGATIFFDDDLTTNLGEISRILPSNKIVLGLPFYGYRWATTSGDKYSLTIGSGITEPLSKISTLIQENPNSMFWDHNSLTPYLVINSNNRYSQIYFDNELSISLKLELITTNGYHGVAIWALGYENLDSPIWDIISTKLR